MGANKSNAQQALLRKIGTKNVDNSMLDRDRLNALFKEFQLDLQLDRENAN